MTGEGPVSTVNGAYPLFDSEQWKWHRDTAPRAYGTVDNTIRVNWLRDEWELYVKVPSDLQKLLHDLFFMDKLHLRETRLCLRADSSAHMALHMQTDYVDRGRVRESAEASLVSVRYNSILWQYRTLPKWAKG